ncbi:hypothetical protein T05_14815, partial [Trichinella murrelli]
LTNWAVSDPGNIFCLIDRPYAKNQTVQSAMAVCIDQAAIFARFNDIAAQVEDCPYLQQLKNVICYAKYEYAFRNKPSSVAILHMITCSSCLLVHHCPFLRLAARFLGIFVCKSKH